MERYQTIFAKEEGAVCAPSAGMHFSKQMFTRLDIKGIDTAYVTFHNGLNQFQSADVEDLSKNKTDSEQMHIDTATVNRVNEARDKEQHILAIGSSTMRALETAVVGTYGRVREYDGWTNKFIYPPYDFRVADSLLINFHLPQTPQLMLATAFGGYEQTMNAYKVAVKKGYQFGPFGDAMLIVE